VFAIGVTLGEQRYQKHGKHENRGDVFPHIENVLKYEAGSEGQYKSQNNDESIPQMPVHGATFLPNCILSHCKIRKG
jgi:hypothetical protein